LSLWVFDRMRKQDAQVSSVLRAVTSPIIRTQWYVDGSGCRDEVTEFVADNLGLPIVGTPTPTTTSEAPAARPRPVLLGRPPAARAADAAVRAHVLRAGLPLRRHRPFRIRKLGPRLPKSIARINVARDGGLVSIQQWGPLAPRSRAAVGHGRPPATSTCR
jgi:hypothetical protein